MKSLKFLPFLVICSIVLVGCSFSNVTTSRQNMTVKIYNITGQDIKNLVVDNQPVGDLAKDSATAKLGFHSIMYDSGYLYPTLSGYIAGFELKNHNWSWCGSERQARTEGKLELDLGITHNDGQAYLYLSEHQ